MLADIDQSKKGRHDHELIQTPFGDVLPCSLIYGANGSGKSTILRSMQLLKRMTISSYRFNDMSRWYHPHLLSEEGDPTKLEIHFLIDGISYAYYVEYNGNEVIQEELYYTPKKRRAKIFTRQKMTVEIGSRFKKTEFANGLKELKQTRTCLSCIAHFSKGNEVIDRVYNWFRKDFVFIFADSDPDFESSTKNALYGNEKEIGTIIKALNEFDVPIKNIEIKKKDLALNPDQFPNFFTEDFRKELAANSEKYIDVIFHYDRFCVNLSNESNGIKKLFYLFGPLLEVLESGKTLVYDELETSLHESVFKKLIYVFQKYGAYNSSQLIFSTHDTGPLSFDLLRKDQIWFTELIKESRSTDLYSLLDIKDVRPSENIQRGYIKGKYGAIPFLNDSFLNELFKKK